MTIAGRFAKRTLDVVGAVAGLVSLAPVMAVTALAVRRYLGGPVIFRQRRPGLDARPFVMYKFRTMTDARDDDGELLPSADRLTALGRVLRSTSLDELPELWNVLKGEMSLVGPRPLMLHYLDRYTPEQLRRHDVKPGITGWAQVNGRNAQTWEDRFALDLWYVDNQSFWLDVRILLATIIQVVRRHGATPEDGEIMSEFFGTARQ